MRVVRKIGIGVGAAFLAGVSVGAIARLLMRAVAVSADHAGEFTLAGSIFIPLVYVAAMIPGAIVAAFTTRWWRWLVVGAGSAFLCLPPSAWPRRRSATPATCPRSAGRSSS